MLNKIRPYKHFIIYGAFIVCALAILEILPGTIEMFGEYTKYVYVGAAIVGLLVFNKFYEKQEKSQFRLPPVRRPLPPRDTRVPPPKIPPETESKMFDNFLSDPPPKKE